MKTTVTLVCVVGLAVGLCLGVGTAQAQVMTMKFAHFADEGHPGHLAAKMFVEAVQKRTNGQIKVQIFPNNALGAPPDQAEQVKMGGSVGRDAEISVERAASGASVRTGEGPDRSVAGR